MPVDRQGIPYGTPSADEDRYAFYAAKIGWPERDARLIYRALSTGIAKRNFAFEQGSHNDDPRQRSAARRSATEKYGPIMDAINRAIDPLWNGVKRFGTPDPVSRRMTELQTRYGTPDIPRVQRGGLGGAFMDWFNEGGKYLAAAIGGVAAVQAAGVASAAPVAASETGAFAGAAASGTVTATGAVTAGTIAGALSPALKVISQFAGGSGPESAAVSGNILPKGTSYQPSDTVMPPDATPGTDAKPKTLLPDFAPFLLLVLFLIVFFFTLRR